MRRTESIAVRPFFGLPCSIQEIMDLVAVRFTEEETFDDSASLKCAVPTHEAKLQLRVPPERLGDMRNWAVASKWGLGVTIQDASKRLSAVIVRTNVNQLPPDGIVDCPMSNVRVGWMGPKGALLSVYIYLVADSVPTIGVPSRQGEIAAMKHFHLNTSGPGAEFPVAFWSGDQFKRCHLPSDTTVVVYGDEGGLMEEKAEEAGLSIAVNDRLRSVFDHARRIRRGNVVQDTVRTLAIAQLLAMAKEVKDLPENSIGFRIARRVLQAVDQGPEALAGMSTCEISAAAQVYCELTSTTGSVV